MALTDAQIRSAKKKPNPYRLSDGRGLFLEIQPTGTKGWRFRGTFNGKRFLLALGPYPDVPLALARERAQEVRELVERGIHPAEHRREQREELRRLQPFSALANEWLEKKWPVWGETQRQKVESLLRRDILPQIGDVPVKSLMPAEILIALRRIEARGAHYAAKTALQICGQILRYGVATGQAERDSAADLRGALIPQPVKHYPALTDPKDVARLAVSIDNYSGTLVVRCALRLAMLLFVRPGELRRMEWTELDFEKKEWRVPAEKMKMRRPHIVPLSRQAIEILEEIRPHTGRGQYVFPGRTPSRPLSENGLGVALKTMGFTGEQAQTAHGFRSIASTNLNEQGWNRDVIERQLAHTEENSVRAAYNYADHLPERREMMQHYADWIDKLKADLLAS